MTLRSAVRELIRRVWVLPVVAVIVGAGAFLVASRHHQQWSATAVAVHTPVKMQHGARGLRRLHLVHTPAAVAIATDYPHPPAGITLTANGRVVIVAARGASRVAVQRSLSAYLGRLKRHWQAQFTAVRSRALAAINARSGARHITPAEISAAIAAVNAVTPSGSIGAITATQTSNPLQPAASAALGAACGLLLGIALILAVYAVRGQIWSAEELAPMDAAVVSVDSRDAADLHRLRVELEALGLAGRRQSVLLSSAGRKDGWSPVARGLAESFADVPNAVVVIDAIGSPGAPANPGVSEFLADPTGPLDVQRISEQIGYVAAGSGIAADRTITADGIAALLAESSKHGRITIIDGPSLDSPLSALLAAAADICVVTVHRGSSTAGAVAAAVARIRRTAATDPILCFDRVKGTRTVPRTAGAQAGRARSGAGEPVAVPANPNR